MSTTSYLTVGSKEKLVMAGAIPFFGLCTTCNNSAICVYRKRRGHDAVQCEMFDCSVVDESNRVKRVVPDVTTMPGVVELQKFKGLCVNCVYRDTCKLSKPEGGVWHCEEYE